MRSPFPGVLRGKKVQFYTTVFAKNVLNKLKFTTRLKIGHTLGSPVPIYLTSFFWIGWNYKLFWFLLLVQRPENGTDIHFWLLESWTGHAQILIDPTAISNFKAYSLHCLMPMHGGESLLFPNFCGHCYSLLAEMGRIPSCGRPESSSSNIW